MSYTILFPDSRSDPLDIERDVAGPDVELINARKTKFDEIDKETWRWLKRPTRASSTA